MDYVNLAGQTVIVASISSTVAAIVAFFKQMATKVSKSYFDEYARRQEELRKETLSKLTELEKRTAEFITRTEMKTELADLRAQIFSDFADVKVQIREINHLLIQLQK